jgi:ribosome-binding factor A
MESIRQQQVGEMVKRNFGQVLLEEGSYIFGDAFVTITKVKMSSDLGLARIYCSVYNTENKQAVILGMKQEYGRLRQALGRRLRKKVRRIPELEFFMDDTLDEMYRLNALFDKLHDEKQMGDQEE